MGSFKHRPFANGRHYVDGKSLVKTSCPFRSTHMRLQGTYLCGLAELQRIENCEISGMRVCAYSLGQPLHEMDSPHQ